MVTGETMVTWKAGGRGEIGVAGEIGVRGEVGKTAEMGEIGETGGTRERWEIGVTGETRVKRKPRETSAIGTRETGERGGVPGESGVREEENTDKLYDSKTCFSASRCGLARSCHAITTSHRCPSSCGCNGGRECTPTSCHASTNSCH